jgi:hypothetical protein
MIYRGPGFLAVVFGSLHLPIIKLSLFLSLPVCRPSSLRTGEGEGKGMDEEPKSYDHENASPSINRSILFDPRLP